MRLNRTIDAQPGRSLRWCAAVAFAAGGFCFGGQAAVAQSAGNSEHDQPVRVIKAQPLVFDAPAEQPEVIESKGAPAQIDTTQEAKSADVAQSKPAPEPVGYGPGVSERAAKEHQQRVAQPSREQDRVTFTADDSPRRGGFAGPDTSDQTRAAPMSSRAAFDGDLLADEPAVQMSEGVQDRGVTVHRYPAPTRGSNSVTWYDGDRVRTARTVYIEQDDDVVDENPHAYTVGGYSRHGLEPTRRAARNTQRVIIIRERDHHRDACRHGYYSSCRHGCHGHHDRHRHRGHDDVFCQHHRKFCPRSCSYISTHFGVGYHKVTRGSHFGVTFGTGHFRTTHYQPFGYHRYHYQPSVCAPVYRRPVTGTRIGVSIGF